MSMLKIMKDYLQTLINIIQDAPRDDFLDEKLEELKDFQSRNKEFIPKEPPKQNSN